MIRIFVSLLAILGSISFALAADAKPTYGATCINCHSKTTGKLSILGSVGTLNLGTARLDGQRPGALKYFIVRKGKTLAISFKVLNASSKYDVDFYFASVKGLKSSRANKLKFTTDPKWYASGSPLYYLLSPGSIAWKNKAMTYVYNLKVSSTTPADIYEIYVNIGGKGGGLWAQQERIYVKVIP